MSSSLLSSALVGEPYFGDSRGRFRGSVLLEVDAADAWAFCRVAGSYHPSANSPRFLSDVSLLLSDLHYGGIA